MPETLRTYIAIDLKSFYASVECVERNLDPLTARLVVADERRTDKTICLAVTPALKALGIPGRARLWEVRQKARHLDYIVTPPRMGLYLEYSRRVTEVYMKYVAPEDIHRYSVDEVFMDITDYMWLYRTTAHELARRIIRDVLETTGITATAGIGENLYLAKVAMDIVAKHIPADSDGVRIAELTEAGYRRQLWNHYPLTDFWRVGRKTAEKLARYGIHTMGQLARMSLSGEALLYKLFGINAELLIDHAWGWEPCRISDIKAYRPKSSSLSSGQVLNRPYPADMARVVVREMAEAMALDLLSKGLYTNQIILTIGYDTECLTRPEILASYDGPVTTDRYGRRVPVHAHGSHNLGKSTCSARHITDAAMLLFRRIVNADLLIRRINLTAANVVHDPDCGHHSSEKAVQLDLFADYAKESEIGTTDENGDEEKEMRLMKASLAIRQRYGKNALLKGVNFDKGATGRERNAQIGGHSK
ncbi:MAG: Y-family DNA polymerase [Bacteroidaceae bacterium]|nr:Y-family DNA polymerase [Bacteroidaceae bacterium]